MFWQKFGTKQLSNPSNEDKLWDVLGRKQHIDVLTGTLSALSHAQPSEITRAAIICDTNVLLRLPTHGKHDQVMDYLTSFHKGPISIPGQVFQELWNNHISVSMSHGDKIKSKFKSFREDVRKEIGSGEVFTKLEELFDQFITENNSIFAEKWIDNLSLDLEALRSLATVRFVDRNRFASLATIRKATRTPPGFKDDSHGDFFVWADGLLGVLDSISGNQGLNDLIVLTGEKKTDWITRGRPHPVLIAEAAHLLGASLTLCDIVEFATLIDKETLTNPAPQD